MLLRYAKSQIGCTIFLMQAWFQKAMNVRYYILLQVSILSLISSMALAIPESAILGPYEVSFDSGFVKSDYNMSIKKPTFDEMLSGTNCTVYSLEIINKTVSLNRASISIVTLENATHQGISSSDIKENLISINSGPHISDIRSSERNIDGSDGAIVSGIMDFDMNGTTILIDYYHAMYPLTFDSSSMVEIVSFYPWNEGTLSILKTIHVERL